MRWDRWENLSHEAKKSKKTSKPKTNETPKSRPETGRLNLYQKRGQTNFANSSSKRSAALPKSNISLG